MNSTEVYNKSTWC